MKSFSPVFLTQHASALQWSLGLLVFDLIVGGFFANQGYWEFEVSGAASVTNALSIFLYISILFLIARPEGPRHAQLMMFLLVLPKPDIAFNFILQQTLVAIIILQPFLNRFQTYSLLLVAFTALPSIRYLADTVNINTKTMLTSAILSPVAEFRRGELISTVDQYYKLYRFQVGHEPAIYRIFRVLPVYNDLKLIKQLEEKASVRSMRIVRSQEGIYSIEESQTLPDNNEKPLQSQLST